MNSRQNVAWTLRGRWIIPVESPAVHRGIITISGAQILTVEPRANRTADIDFGNAAILPGLVNAHSHLDLRSLGRTIPSAADFTDWLRMVIQQRRCLSPHEILRNIRAGLKQSLAYGTTLLGDISGQGLSYTVLAKTRRCRSVVFYELLGLPRTRAHRAWAAACEWLRGDPSHECCRRGLSPHAPYSVRASLFRAAARLSQQQRVPLAIHLAETREELDLLGHHRGPFIPFLSELGVWDERGLARGVRDVLQLVERADRLLLVHGNYLDASVPLPRGASIIYCPRTHAAFGHGPYPLRELLARGVRVALGTDSLASNPDLDILAEARFVHRLYPDLPGATLVRMATLSGAEALGWHNETGSLIPGKSADLVVLELPAEDHERDPYESIFSSSTRVQAVLFRGKWVSRRDTGPFASISKGARGWGFAAPDP